MKQLDLLSKADDSSLDGILLFYGGKEEVEFPEVRRSKYPKNFSWGFYCAEKYEQAKRWAKKNGKSACVSYYRYLPNEDLNALSFPAMNDEWLDFIIHCRIGGIHSYDIVEGPMADDTIWDYISSLVSGDISRAAFWELAKFKYPTHQISFHTLSALACIKFERSEFLEYVESKR